MLLLSLFIHGFLSTLFPSRTTLISSGQTIFMFFKHFKLIESNPNSCFLDQSVLYHPFFTSVLSQFSSLTIIHFILGVRSGSLTFLLPMYVNCRPPSHHSILCIFHFSQFLTKCILLAMCLVCLVSLPFLAMNIEDLLSKTIKGAYFVTMSGSSFINS